MTNGLIDYAGLFPPAQLSMRDALAADAEARAGPYAAMVGNFVVPSSLLDEMAASGGPRPPSVSVIVDRHIDRALGAIDDFTFASVASIETPRGVNAIRGEMVEMLSAWSAKHGDRSAIYCEVIGAETPVAAINDAIGQLAVIRRGTRTFCAKIRTGGATREAFPATELVAHAIAECARHRVPFKATSGLYHPLRGTFDGLPMHGFINLLLAAVVALRDPDARRTIVAAIEEEDPAAFVFEDDALIWRDRRFGAATLAGMRMELFVAFGSYSISEPVDALREIGFMS